MPEILEFKVSSALKSIVGKDLITNDYVAIFEIVKNSFDALATYVTLTFEDDSLIIADNGKGMSLDDIKNKWLFLAYSAKKDGSEDISNPKGNDFRDKIQERRYYAGAKGIGRFSSDRLGKELTLTTKTINANNCERIFVDWTKFEEDQKKEFVDISVVHETVNCGPIFPNNYTHGTILQIDKLNDKWSRNKLRQLRHSLEKLINPFNGQDEFTIEIICDKERSNDDSNQDGERINGILQNTILDALNLKTTGIEVTISPTDIITEIRDRGVNIYKIREPNLEPLLAGTFIKLLFLNRSARHTFTLRMGIQSVNYGSVFLYKNGFRIYPYGEPNDDDSWRIDSRKQQGYNRYLGSRDLIGKVEINTINNDEFKETSSRDGGLVQTHGVELLHEAFEKAHRRLERYVVGVLWGEGFIKKDFFIDEEIGKEKRKELSADKDLDDISSIRANLGSRLDFTQIIKGLAKDKDVEILEYNQELTKFIADELDTVKIDILKDVEEIAIRTGNETLKEEIDKISIALQEEIARKEEAQFRAQEAERKLQEEKAKKEEAERRARESEERRKQEEIAKKEAELKAKDEELKRKEAELRKLEAEQKAKEEEERRKNAENIIKKKEQQLKRSRAAETIEYKDLRDSNHIIGVYSDDISKKILLLKRKIDKNQNISNKELVDFIKGISFANEKIATLTRFTTKSNFLEASLESTEDIVNYIKIYIEEIYKTLYQDVEINVIDNGISLIKTFEPIELSMALDNMISNSRKKNASKIILEFYKNGDNVFLSVKDIGRRLDKSITDYNLIFEEGITTTKGSGLGLSHVKRIIEDGLKAKINYNPEYTDGFELIISF